MTEILLSAVSTGFLTVRFIKGAWFRNPQYLAIGICGALAAVLLLRAFSPEMADGFVVGGVAGVAGSWGAMALFDAVLGAV